MKITNHQIGKVERKVMALAQKIVDQVNVATISLKPIIGYEGGFEQFEDIRHEVFVRADIKTIISEELRLDEWDMSYDDIDYQYLDEHMELFETEVTHKLPDEWYGFFRDGDFYVGRYFENLDQIEALGILHLSEVEYV